MTTQLSSTSSSYRTYKTIPSSDLWNFFPALEGKQTYTLQGAIQNCLYGRIYLGFDLIREQLVIIKINVRCSVESKRQLVTGKLIEESDTTAYTYEQELASIHTNHPGKQFLSFSIDRFEDEYYTYTVYEHYTKGDLFSILRFTRQGYDDEGIQTSKNPVSSTKKDEVSQIKKGIPLEKLKKYIIQIALALDFLHVHGYAHRDLALENICIDRHDNVKLIDYGLMIKSDGASVISGAVGRIQYCSNEALFHSKGDIFKNDIFALGVITFSLLTGAPPFTGEVRMNVWRKIMTNGSWLVSHSYVNSEYAKNVYIHQPQWILKCIDSMFSPEAVRLSLHNLLYHPMLQEITLSYLRPSISSPHKSSSCLHSSESILSIPQSQLHSPSQTRLEAQTDSIHTHLS